jgi:hypothetical protein
MIEKSKLLVFKDVEKQVFNIPAKPSTIENYLRLGVTIALKKK